MNVPKFPEGKCPKATDVSPWFGVYILRCANSTLYVGSTHDLQSRLKAHNTARGAAYTFKYRPVHLVYSEKYPSKIETLTRERQIKHWSHSKKEALVFGNRALLKQLRKRRP